MEASIANFTFENHPVIYTLRMKGVSKSKFGDRSNSSKQEKYSETQLTQIFNKIELSSSMVSAFKGIPYYRHFDSIRLQKLITINANFPSEIVQAIPYYILHAAVSYCFSLEESNSSENLPLVLKSLVFLYFKYQLPAAENMFYFIIKFASYNSLSLDTRVVLDNVENLIKVKNSADKKLFSALIFWASNTRSTVSPSDSEEDIKKCSNTLDEDTKMILSYIDELLKRYQDCIVVEDASLLFARIERPLNNLEPFGMSIFSTIFKYLPKELLVNFYKKIPQSIKNFVHNSKDFIRYKKVDLTSVKEATVVKASKVPQIIHSFRDNLFFNYETKFPEHERIKAKIDPILGMYNILVCSTNRETIANEMIATLEEYSEKEWFYDFVSCFLQMTNVQACYTPFYRALFNTDIFDPRITIFGEQTEEVKKMLELRSLALDKILENRYISISECLEKFVEYPEISAELFMRLSDASFVETHHYLDFPQIGLLYIPYYQEVHAFLNDELKQAGEDEKEALKEKLRIVERCRMAMIHFFVVTMEKNECFDVYTHNGEFLSLLSSLAYEKQIADVILDSIFAHFENASECFLKQIPDILSVLTSPRGDFTNNNIELVTSILKRLCKIDEKQTVGMEQIKRNILDSFEKEDVQFTEDYLVYSIRFISLVSFNYEFTDEDSAMLSKAITKICGDEPFHLVQLELISLIAGKQLDALSTDFLIKQPYALPLLIRPFEKCSRLKGLISFVEQLCIFSTTNARQCQKGKLDLALLDLLLSRYHKLDANIDDPNEARLISESLSLIAKISAIASSRTAVQKFITMFCPIEGKFVSPLLPQAVSTMTSILINGHNIPSGFLPLTNREPYINVTGINKFDILKGFTVCFWVFIDSGSSRIETRIFTMTDKSGDYITISLSKSMIIVTINDESNTFSQILGQEEWIFFAVTFEKGKNLTNVSVYSKSFVDYSILQYKAFDFEMGYINCQIGKQLPNENLEKNEHPILLGPFAIYQPVHDINSLRALDNAGSHSLFDQSFFSVFFEEEGSVLTLRTKKENSITATIVGPSVFQVPLFQDVFLRSYQVTSLIPLFAQANISDKIEVKPIINLLKTVLSISSEAKGDFEKYSRFTVVAFLLKKFDVEIYTAFYEMFVMFQSNTILQYQIVTEILTNIRLLSLAPPEAQVQITNHWFDSILPIMEEKLKKRNDFRGSLLKTIEYFHGLCPAARDNVFKSLLFKANCQLSSKCFLELLTQCQKVTDEEIAYELIKLVKSIITHDDITFDNTTLQQLMIIHKMMKRKSVRIVSTLLDIIVILDEKKLFRNSLIVHLEVVRIMMPKEVLNEEFLVDVLKRAQTIPYFFSLACYALAVHPKELQATFVKNMPTACEEYNRANKAWPFWPFIAAITCGGDTMNAIFEFVLKTSIKIWETVYVILEITSKLLNSPNANPQNQFFTIMSTYARGNKQNEAVFRKLCFTYIFTKKGQTHNKALINRILKSDLDGFVDKDFLAKTKEEVCDINSLIDHFSSKLKELSHFQKFTFGLNMTPENRWEDYPLSYVLGDKSPQAQAITKFIETRNKKEDFTEQIEQSLVAYSDEIDMVSIEFNRLCTFIGKFVEKAYSKSIKFSGIRLPKMQNPVYVNVAAQWKTLWSQQTIESAPWSSSIIVREKHFMRDQTFCYAGCPMKMKVNKHFTNHKEAAVMRDYGSAEIAKELIESERRKLEEKYKKEAPPELFQVSRHREDSDTSENIPVLYKYKGEIIKLTHISPCVLNIFNSGLKIDVFGSKESTTKLTKSILIRNVMISRISFRSYLHHPTGLEIFCYDGSSHFINLKTKSTLVLRQIAGADGWQKCNIQIDLSPQAAGSTEITEKWSKGEESNFEYLMFLNRASGRTFNNASLYPFMPWVLTDYTSDELDLNNPDVFRDLSKPVGHLGEQRYKEILRRKKEIEELSSSYYMFSSFYVSPLCVYLWLMRMEPFTTLHTILQSGKFDHAARLFTNVAETFNMVTTHMNDFRELIPEFYFCPHFLKNENDFDLGSIDGEKKINDVELPPWADNALDFVYKMRKALESKYVSENLDKWIDLIWGIYSQGDGAVNAGNTFDPKMYESVWTEKTLNDPEERSLIEATMKHCGQVPNQLFFKKHIKRNVKLDIRSDAFDTGLNPTACSFINGKIIFVDNNNVLSCYQQNKVEEIEHLSFHPDQDVPIACFNGKVVLASSLGYIEFFDIDKRVSLFKVFPHTCRSACLSASSRFVCSGGTDSTLYLFDHLMMNNGSIPLFRDEVVDCSISDTFHIAAAITKDSFLFIVDTTRVIVRQSMHFDEVPRFVCITPSWGFIVVAAGSKGNESIYVYTSEGELIRQCKFPNLSKMCTFPDRFGFDYICVADDKGSLKCVEAYYINKLSDSSKSYPAMGPLCALCYDSGIICVVTKTGRCVQFTPDYLTQ